jgi:DNA-binding MarR family transcriptional regulator
VGARVPWVALAAFRHNVRRFLSFNEQAVQREGLEPGQHHLLLAIRALSLSGEPTIRQLSEQVVRRHHSTVELIDRLETSKLVRRMPHPTDGRKVCVQLTPKGEAVLDRLTATMLEEYRDVAARLVHSLRAIVKATSGSGPRRTRR